MAKEVAAPDILDVLTQGPRALDMDDYGTTRKVVRQRNRFFHGTSKKFLFKIQAARTQKPEKRRAPSVNAHILKLAKRNKDGFVQSFGDNIEAIRTFLVQDLAPKLLPVMSAVDEASDVLTEILGDKVSSSMYATLVKQLSTAAEVKTASWISTYLNLDSEDTQRFFSKLHLDIENGKKLSNLQALRNLQGQKEGNTEVLLRKVLAAQKAKS